MRRAKHLLDKEDDDEKMVGDREDDEVQEPGPIRDSDESNLKVNGI